MNRTHTTFIIFAFAFFCLPALLSFGIRYLPVDNQPPLGVTKKFYGNVVMEDRVTEPYNNFNGIGLSFKNPNLENKEEILLNIAKENGVLVRSVTLSGRVVPDGGFVRFMFEPIEDSRGNKYILTLTSPSSRRENSLEVYLSKDSSGTATVLYYKPPPIPNLISDIYTNWIKRLLIDKFFAVFYLGAVALGIGYVLFGKKQTI